MLYLVFHLGTERYILPAPGIVEILPAVEVRPIPGAGASMAGVFNYRGHLVPLWDVSQLILGRPAQLWLSSRIVLVRQEQRENLVGLLVERATETLQLNEADLVEHGEEWRKAPYLGPVMMDAGGVLQVIRLEALLTACHGELPETELPEPDISPLELPETDIPADDIDTVTTSEGAL